MENLERYKHLNKYLKEKFGQRTLKICIDGGFTCPNRTNSNGCIFCSERVTLNSSLPIPSAKKKMQPLCFP